MINRRRKKYINELSFFLSLWYPYIGWCEDIGDGKHLAFLGSMFDSTVGDCWKTVFEGLSKKGLTWEHGELYDKTGSLSFWIDIIDDWSLWGIGGVAYASFKCEGLNT